MFSIDVEASKRCASDLELVADTLEKVRGALASASVEGAMAGSAGLRVQQSIQRASDVAQVYGRGAASLSVALSQIADTYTKAESGAIERYKSITSNQTNNVTVNSVDEAVDYVNGAEPPVAYDAD